MSSRCITTCRSASAQLQKARFIALAVSPFLWVGLSTAALPQADRDAKLRETLVGTWALEVSAKYDFPLTARFMTYHRDGRFVQIAIGEISGTSGRIELGGSWSVENGKLIQRLSKAPVPTPAIGQTQKAKIVSVDQDSAVLVANGRTGVLRRAPLPAKLPAVSGWLLALMRSKHLVDSFALKKPLPSYPNELRSRSITEGSGIFRLIVDAEGNVKTVQLVQGTGHQLLDRAAVTRLAKWQFVPGKVDEVVIPVVFKQ